MEGRIFAFTSEGRLVVKLPRERVDALVGAGEAERFDPRRDGRAMREWACVGVEHHAAWMRLAREAYRYVGSAER